MSGTIPPSIVSYEIVVDTSSDKYVTVSFPFRVRIQKVWFTGDSSTLWNGIVGDEYAANRKLKLAAWVSKNTREQYGVNDNPSDMTNFFGSDPGKPYYQIGDAALKPTMWLGSPDGAGEEGANGQQVNVSGGGWRHAFRSTVKSAPDLHSPSNIGWGNPDWTEEQAAQRMYKTDLAIMDTDHMLSLFVYTDGGNWENYNNEGWVTVHIAYTGMWDESRISAPKANFNGWWD